jgi:hypothetical protein
MRVTKGLVIYVVKSIVVGIVFPISTFGLLLATALRPFVGPEQRAQLLPCYLYQKRRRWNLQLTTSLHAVMQLRRYGSFFLLATKALVSNYVRTCHLSDT